MENPATLGDLRDRWHPNPLDDSDAENVAAIRLDEAWRALQGELPGLVQRIASGMQETGAVVDVICSAALRVLRNPEGYTDGTISVDDFSKAWKYAAEQVSNDLYFTAAELRRLSPYGGGAFTITPGRRR